MPGINENEIYRFVIMSNEEDKFALFLHAIRPEGFACPKPSGQRPFPRKMKGRTVWLLPDPGLQPGSFSLFPKKIQFLRRGFNHGAVPLLQALLHMPEAPGKFAVAGA